MTHAQFRWKTINYMKNVPYEVHASIACVAGVERGRGRGNLIDVGSLVQKDNFKNTTVIIKCLLTELGWARQDNIWL